MKRCVRRNRRMAEASCFCSSYKSVFSALQGRDCELIAPHLLWGPMRATSGIRRTATTRNSKTGQVEASTVRRCSG